MTNASGVTTGGLRLAGECGERGPLTRADPPRCLSVESDRCVACVCAVNPPRGSKPRFPRLVPASAVLALRSRAASRCIARRRDPEPCTPEADTGGFLPESAFGAFTRRSRTAYAVPESRSRNGSTETSETPDVLPELARLPPLPALSRLSGRELLSPRGECVSPPSETRISRGRLSSRRLVSAEREALRTNGSLRRRASGGAPAPTRRGGRRPVPRARRRSRADAAEDLLPDHFFASEAASAALRPRPRRRRETRARPGRPRAASHAPPDPRRALCSPYFFEKVSVKNNSSPPPRSSAARTGGPRTRGGALLTPSSEAPPRRARRAARRPARFRPKLRLNAPRRARRPARRWRRAARR